MNTRRYPRTLNEAFGPYCGNVVHPMREAKFWTPIRIALVVVYAAALVTLVCLLWGGK